MDLDTHRYSSACACTGCVSMRHPDVAAALASARAELERVRAIVVRVADAVGAKVSQQSSVDFMEDVPREVSLVLERVRAERDEARRDFFKVAEAIGMVNYPEGQTPWPASADQIAESVRRDASDRERLTARAEKAEAERDEAREKAANSESAANFVFQGANNLRADRDEWRTQHENAVACWYEERDRLAVKIASRDAFLREVVAALESTASGFPFANVAESPFPSARDVMLRRLADRARAILRELGEDGEKVGR